MQSSCSPNRSTVEQVQGALLQLPSTTVSAVVGRAAAARSCSGEAHRQFRATATVKESLGRFPAGLGPTLTDLGVTAPTDELSASLADVPDDVSAVLERLTWGPPTGRIENADRHRHSRDRPRHLSNGFSLEGLLVPADKVTVVLPREIALVLRRRTGGSARLQPHSPDLVIDRTRPGRASIAPPRVPRSNSCDKVEDLLETWAVDAPSVLRSGGLGVRDLRTLRHPPRRRR